MKKKENINQNIYDLLNHSRAKCMAALSAIPNFPPPSERSTPWEKYAFNLLQMNVFTDISGAHTSISDAMKIMDNALEKEEKARCKKGR